jgi:hypothetical protein
MRANQVDGGGAPNREAGSLRNNPEAIQGREVYDTSTIERAGIEAAWAVCVNEWDGAGYHERIVGPFDTEDQAETWALDCPDPTSVFDLMPPTDWKRADA